ncbi:MAG TPA: aldo/keto reductase [Actinomycetota bacterium]|nr:aldo/keto reductase [Actinomycetota bacterium]
MEYRQLGRLGVKVSPLCLGTMNWGWQTDEKPSWAIMDRALDVGINFFDTANGYGRPRGKGVTEQIIGRWFGQGGGRRERVVLATKVYGRMGEWPNFSRLSAVHIRQACDESLRRLQTDHIDLYQMHHIDWDTSWEEIWEAMENLIRAGKVLYVGTSNFPGWAIAQGNEIARARHLLGLASEQCLYNLNARMSELEVLPACEAYGIGVIPWSPLAAGLLAGALEKVEDGRRSTGEFREKLEKDRSKIEAYEKLCADLGEQPADVALAWLLENPVVTAPIIGPRTIEQLDAALRSLEVQLDDRTMRQLDRIFPGPGGRAPDAYAW